jgi:AraC-like DNA-binding protein
MLAETNYSIGEIIEKCGFSDNSNFSRTFKRLTGLSPSDFRKKYKAE